MPETQLGIIPVGAQRNACRGSSDCRRHSISFARAERQRGQSRRIGLVDAAVPSVVFAGTAKRFALGQHARLASRLKLQNMWPLRPIACRVRASKFRRAREPVSGSVAGHRCNGTGSGGHARRRTGGRGEDLGEVSATPVCKNLIRIFSCAKSIQTDIDTGRVERTGRSRPSRDGADRKSRVLARV